MKYDKKYAEAADLFYSTLPLIKKYFMHTSTGIQGDIPHHLYSTLLYVYYCGKRNMSSISDYLGLSKPLVTQQVDKLVETGYLNRKYNSDDRRIIEIDITDKGKKSAKEITSFFREKGALALSKLSESELQKFTESISTIKKVLSGIDFKDNTVI